MNQEEITIRISEEINNCSNESELRSLLKSKGINTSKSEHEGHTFQWKYHSDSSSNKANYTANGYVAIQALIEKLVNSQDSLLMKKSHELGIDPKGEDSPATLNDAKKTLFDVEDGNWASKTANAIKGLNGISYVMENEETQMKSANPCINVLDDGIGVSHHDVYDKFLSNGISDKRDIPWATGRYRRGATGVFNFANAEVTLTKPAPCIVDKNKANSEDWSLILLLSLTPSELKDWGFAKNPSMGALVYLTINGDIPHFKSDEIDVHMGGIKKDNPKMTARGLNKKTHGTWVRIFDFDINQKIQTISGLNCKNVKSNTKLGSVLKSQLVDCSYPINGIQPRVLRGEGNSSGGNDLSNYCGLKSHMDLNHKIGKQNQLNHKYLIDPIHISHISGVSATFYFLKSTDFLDGNTGIHYVIGVQSQLFIPRSKLNQDWDFGVVCDHVVGIIDLNQGSTDMKDKISSVGRDQIRDCEEFLKIKDKIKSDLQESVQYKLVTKMITDQLFEKKSKDTESYSAVDAYYKNILTANKVKWGDPKHSQKCNGSDGFGGECDSESKVKLQALLSEADLISKNFSNFIGHDKPMKKVDLNGKNYQIEVQTNAKTSYLRNYGVSFEYSTAPLGSVDWVTSSDVSLINEKEDGIFHFNIIRNKTHDNSEGFSSKLLISPKSAKKHDFEPFEILFDSINARINDSPKPNKKDPIAKKKPSKGTFNNKFSLQSIKSEKTNQFLININKTEDSERNDIKMSEHHLIGFTQTDKQRDYVINIDNPSFQKNCTIISKKLRLGESYVRHEAVKFFEYELQEYQSNVSHSEQEDSSYLIDTSHYSYNSNISFSRLRGILENAPKSK